MKEDEEQQVDDSCKYSNATTVSTNEKLCNDCSSPSSSLLKYPMFCARCSDQIIDKYYMVVDGRFWHEKCVQCTSCHQQLTSSCFSKHYKLYCNECYNMLKRCYGCSEILRQRELVLRVGPDSYHVTCFKCNYCSRLLHKGDHFYSFRETTKRKICCQICYDINNLGDLQISDSDDSPIDNYAFSPDSYSCQYLNDRPTSRHLSRQLSADYPYGSNGQSHYNQAWYSCDDQRLCQSLPVMTSSDPRRPKRPRTVLTTEQRKKFNSWYEISAKPSRKVREKLAKETGLTPRIVQVWFQNQRAKMKKTRRQRKSRKKIKSLDYDDNSPPSPGSPSPTTRHFEPSDYDIPALYQSPTSLLSIFSQDEDSMTVLLRPSTSGHDWEDAKFQMENFNSPVRSVYEIPSFPQSILHSPSRQEIHDSFYQENSGVIPSHVNAERQCNVMQTEGVTSHDL